MERISIRKLCSKQFSWLADFAKQTALAYFLAVTLGQLLFIDALAIQTIAVLLYSGASLFFLLASLQLSKME